MTIASLFGGSARAQPFFRRSRACADSWRLLFQLFQHSLRRLVAGTLFEKFEQHRPCFVQRVFEGVDSGEIQVSLIESRRNLNALLKSCDRLIPPLSSQIKHSKVI